MPDCSALSSDIQACQAKGKLVTLSLGGATGAVGFTSDSQAESFADTIWDIFLGGSSSIRPFGDAVLDGYDSKTIQAAAINLMKQCGSRY
jgi:chitinase